MLHSVFYVNVAMSPHSIQKSVHQALKTTRRIAIAFPEYLDRAGLTRREDDRRTLRESLD